MIELLSPLIAFARATGGQDVANMESRHAATPRSLAHPAHPTVRESPQGCAAFAESGHDKAALTGRLLR